MSKITELTTLASVSADDIFPVVNDPAGTPATQKVTLAALKTSLGLTGTNSGDQDLSGKSDTSHTHTGVYATVLGADDNYVTDAEKTKLANLSGTNTGDQTLPTDATIATTDVTTNNASTSKHGWLPKLSNVATEFLNGQGAFTTPAGGTTIGYTLSVQALTSSPADGATVYFGQLPKAPITTAAVSRVYIRKAGTIKMANIFCYSGTAGTGESWSLYIRLNNTTDTLIETLAVATNERTFDNSSLSIAVSAGDYIEIKSVQPTWATNPLTTIWGGYIYIE